MVIIQAEEIMEKKIIDFYGDGCGNCKMLEGILKQLEGEYTDVKFEKVNIKDAEDLAEQYGVTTLPSLVFLRDGEMVEKMTGLKPKTIISKKIIEIYN